MAAKQAGPEKRPEGGGAGRRASWRGADSAAEPESAKYNWQRSSTDKHNPALVRKIRRRRIKLLVSTSLLCALVATFVWYLLKSPRSTPLLAVALTDYPAPWPANAFALEDVSNFEASGNQSSGPSRWSFGSWLSGRGAIRAETVKDRSDRNTQTALETRITDWLKRAKPGGPDRGWLGGGGCLVLYLSGHGDVGDDLRPCLILENDGERLWIDDLIHKLDEDRPEVHKLVILDTNRHLATWSAGLVYNGFAEAIENSKALNEARSVAVLLSAGRGEVAWAAPEQQDTPFGRFVGQALAGDSDADTTPHDRKISALELHKFVQQKVEQWVAAHRAAQQRPVLLPKNRDFQVVFVDDRAPSIEAAGHELLYLADDKAKTNWEKLDDLWKRNHELLRSPDDVRMPPWYDDCLAWHQLQQGLVRCEQLVLSGAAYREQTSDDIDAMTEVIKRLEHVRDRAPPLHNLATVHTWHSSRPESNAFADFKRRLAAPEGDPARAWPEPDYYVRASDAWQWLLESGEKGDMINAHTARQALKLVGEPPEGKAELAELHLLDLMAGKTDRPWTGAPPEMWQDQLKPLISVLKIRRLAEQTTAVEDPRIHFAISSEVASADEKLRALEDSIFAGVDGPDQTKAKLDAANSVYHGVLDESRKLAKCFTTRDRAWAWLPYLIEWSLSVPGDQNQIVVASAALERAVEFDSQLEKYLAEHARSKDAGRLAQPAASDDRLSESEEALAKSLTDLKNNLDNFADDAWANVGSSDELKLRNIELVLANPLVGWQQRRELRNYLSGHKPEVTKALPPEERKPYYYDRLVAWCTKTDHPAITLAGAGTPDNARQKKEPVDWRLFAAERKRLRTSGLAAMTADPLAAEDATTIDRAKISEKERPLRRAAALCALLPSRGTKDAIHRLAQFDRNELLMWQAQRRLDDFWGPDDGNQPYFAQVFDDGQKAAEDFAAELTVRWDDVQKRRDERLEATRLPLMADSKSELPTVVDGKFIKSVMPVENRWPKGIAALSAWEPPPSAQPALLVKVAADGQPLANPGRRLGIDTPLDGEPFDLQVSQIDPEAGALAAGVGNWNLDWVFRGHDGKLAFPVRKPGPPLELVYDWKPSDTATVTVKGDIKEATVVFILDCSASMLNKVKVVEKEEEVTKTRMELATNALHDIVDRLARSGTPDVGMWLYGHRFGFTQAGLPKRNNSKTWRTLPKNLLAGDDVECEASIGPLDVGQKQRIKEVLTAAEALGMTPLYLAMVEALDGFGRHLQVHPIRGPCRLIVITDGVNHQTDKNCPEVRSLTGWANVRGKFESIGLPIKMDLLYCGSQNDAESREKLDELKTLINHVRGEFIPVDDLKQLELKLQDVLGLKEFEVRDSDGKPAKAATNGPYSINSFATIKDNFGPGNPHSYDVRTVDQELVHAPIALEGGENLTLKLLPGGKRLEHDPYPRDRQSSPQFVTNRVALGTDPKEFRVVPYRPDWKLGRLRFALSVQNRDPTRFSPRPREAWIEITPIDNKQLAPYPCYDLAYEASTPVPVLYCDVPKWPEGATRASLKLWFRLHSSEAMARESGGARIADCDEFSRPRPLGQEWLDGVKFIVKTVSADKGCELLVEEQHLKSGPPEWARVQLEISERPDRIVREFDYEGKMARHHFHFLNRTRQQISNGAVQVTSQKALKRDAATVADPFEVEIPERARGT